jgi:hypothetical protein
VAFARNQLSDHTQGQGFIRNLKGLMEPCLVWMLHSGGNFYGVLNAPKLAGREPFAQKDLSDRF